MIAGRGASASGSSGTEAASRALEAPRLARLLWVPLLVAPIRLALGALGVVGARLAGLDADRALITFALGAGVMMVSALGDPRARLLGARGEPEPVPANAIFASPLEIAARAAFPSTVGVAVLAGVALAFEPVLASVLAGLLAGMGLAALVSIVQLASEERRAGVELYAESGRGRRRFIRSRAGP